MDLSSALSESDEQRLDQDVTKHWHDEVISGSPKLNVKKSPFVKGGWIGVENVGWILVHGDRSFGNSEDLERGP